MSVMTEAVAVGTKQCPRLNDGCMASRCMSWRWAVLANNPDDNQYLWLVADLVEAKLVAERFTHYKREIVGYCGEAGVPAP